MKYLDGSQHGVAEYSSVERGQMKALSVNWGDGVDIFSLSQEIKGTV